MTQRPSSPAAASRMPTQVLRDARRRDSRTKRARVLQIVQDMTRNGDRVTFSAVARAANVSTWLTYADGVREHIEHAIRQQTERPQHSKAVPPSQAGLRTDLELAREEIRRLRSERERLQQAVRQKLGHQLDQLGAQDLATRVQELTQANTSLEARLQEATTAKGSLELRVVELEDELAAARTSLRRMMRDRN